MGMSGEAMQIKEPSARYLTKAECPDVPPGYRRSPVGVIPSDWNVRKLVELTSSVASGTSKIGNSNGEYPLHGSTGVIGYTDRPDYEGPAILVARVGANAGTLNSVKGKYGVTDNTIIIRLRAAANLEFIRRQLEGKHLNRLVFGSGQPLITGTQLKSIDLAEPTADEQRAIAEALSDVDGCSRRWRR